MIPFIRRIWRALAMQVSTFKEAGENEMDAGSFINRTSMLVLFLPLLSFNFTQVLMKIGVILGNWLNGSLSIFQLLYVEVLYSG